MTSLLVTGGIGSGKSLLCRFLSEAGVPVFDSDSQAKDLYAGPEVKAALTGKFGDSILDGDGMVDKKTLGTLIFNDPDALKWLESLIHPMVFEKFFRWRGALDTRFCVFESAIILEKDFPDSLADEVIFVDAPLEVRVARAMERDGRGEEEIMERVRAQKISPDDPRVTFIVRNDSGVDALRKRTEVLLEILKEKYK